MKDLPHCIRLVLNFYLLISLLTCNKYFVPLCHLGLPWLSQLLQFHWQADFFDWMLYLHILALYWVTIRLTEFISCFISDWALEFYTSGYNVHILHYHNYSFSHSQEFSGLSLSLFLPSLNSCACSLFMSFVHIEWCSDYILTFASWVCFIIHFVMRIGIALVIWGREILLTLSNCFSSSLSTFFCCVSFRSGDRDFHIRCCE